MTRACSSPRSTSSGKCSHLAAEDDDAVGVGVRALDREHVIADPKLTGDLAVFLLGVDVQRLVAEAVVPNELHVFALREGRRAVVGARASASSMMAVAALATGAANLLFIWAPWVMARGWVVLERSACLRRW